MMSVSASRMNAGPVLPAGRKPSRFFRNIKWLFGLTIGVGVGFCAYRIQQHRFPAAQEPVPEGKKRLLVLGSGWGSVSVLKNVDSREYDITVVSPRNYFLFTPLLPSCTTGCIEHRSIMEPIRSIIRGKKAEAKFVEAEVTKIDPYNRTVTVSHRAMHDNVKSEQIPDLVEEMPYDYLVIGVGSEVSTYGIPGVQEYGCYLKEIEHAQQIRKRIMDCFEAASFPGVDPETRKRLLTTVVVGGGPTGVEFAGELHDFYVEDLKALEPNLRDQVTLTLIEALPNVLPSFSKHLCDYAEKTLLDEKINVLTKTAVKKVTSDTIYAEKTLPDGRKEEVVIPYGLFVWAGGNSARPIIKDLFSVIPEQATARRGLLVDEYLQVLGTDGVWAIGDCTSSHYAPTAQVAAQQGSYVGRLLNQIAERDDTLDKVTVLKKQLDDGLTDKKVAANELRHWERRLEKASKLKQFQYSHQGSLAYVGSEKAVADLSFWGNAFASGGTWTFMFWRSAYLSMCFSIRNRLLVMLDWTKVRLFGRDVSRE